MKQSVDTIFMTLFQGTSTVMNVQEGRKKEREEGNEIIVLRRGCRFAVSKMAHYSNELRLVVSIIIKPNLFMAVSHPRP